MEKFERKFMVICMDYIMRSLNDESLTIDSWFVSGVAVGDIDFKKLSDIMREKIDEISDFDYYIQDTEFADLMDTFLFTILEAFNKYVSPEKRLAILYCDGVCSAKDES